MGRAKLQIVIVDARKAARKFQWGEIVNGYKVYACHEAQLDVLSSRAKFTFAFAGSGGGKTCLIPLWLFKRILENPKGRFLVVSPTAATFDSSQLKQHILQTFEGTDFQGEWQEGKKTYKLPTGGEIIVKTVGDGADYQRLIGGQYDAAVADECYQLSIEVWEEIRRRVSNKNGPILAVTTPTGNNWIWDAKQAAESGDKDYYVRHWAKTANPTVSKEDVEREKQLQSEAKYKRMVLGEFAAAEGLIYECFADPNHCPVIEVKGDPLEALPSPPVRFVGGNDWGYNPDPAAVLMLAECEDGCVYVVEEIYGRDITPDDLAQRAKDMIDRWALKADGLYADLGLGQFIGFYTDTSRPEAAAQFRRAGIPIRNKLVDDIETGIAITDAWFRAGRLKVFSTCRNLIRELRGYQWETDRRGDLKAKPKGKDDHAVDALRYAVSSRKRGERVTPLVASSRTPEEVRAAEADKLRRLKFVTISSALPLEEKQRQAANRRLFEMAWGDVLND